ncbi:hypothetical protein SP15_224 [Bacillus phage SP-15]|uniref:Uncharacterized protein n=1 Tax=Bacillus phage SP-15 TaxID=1792032 RepID=A0A127AWK3_9CAUD|nr:hypothetical protein SP15_224 [Bacillus phage SP-15]AMM45025.1 hypothetical protein SP15_224 [Bacillus phage SP-15]
MNNVVEFEAIKKSKEKQDQESLEFYRSQVLDQFLSAIGKSQEEIMTKEEVQLTIKQFMSESTELVFANASEAIAFGAAILDLPEFDRVSHFQVNSNISRKSVFYSLTPVYKSLTSYKFASDELLQGVSLMNIMGIKSLEEDSDE